jgi:predicted MFS family arabinose efflux permease
MVAEAAVTARRFPTAAPDGLLAAALLAFLATAGFFYVNIMAALVPGLVDGLGFSEGDAGRVGSLNIYGAALGALVAVALAGRVRWRAVAACLLVTLIVLDASSMLVMRPGALMALRFVHGMVGGCLVGVAYSVFARTRSPDRVFGMLLAVQYGLGGLGVMVLPRLVPVYGHGVLFATLVAFSLCALLILPFLDSYPAGRIERPAASGGIRKGLLAATAVALFLFQAGNMALLVYMIPLARHFGLETGYASTVLGLSTWIGIAGCLAVIVFGTRYGRAWPLATATAVTAVACYAFLWSGVPGVFLLANCVSGIMWSFVASYLLGMCAEFDQAGRTAALGGFVSKMGLASGPFVAAALMDRAGYPELITAAAVAVALSLPFMFVPALRLDRARKGDAPL